MDKFLRIAEIIAKEWVAVNVVQEASDAAFAIIDGMDGMISEQGESVLWKFWKRDILRRWDSLAGKKVGKDELLPILHDLIDGLEGVVSEQGEVPSYGYWKSDVLRKAKDAERRLKMV